MNELLYFFKSQIKTTVVVTLHATCPLTKAVPTLLRLKQTYAYKDLCVCIEGCCTRQQIAKCMIHVYHTHTLQSLKCMIHMYWCIDVLKCIRIKSGATVKFGDFSAKTSNHSKLWVKKPKNGGIGAQNGSKRGAHRIHFDIGQFLTQSVWYTSIIIKVYRACVACIWRVYTLIHFLHVYQAMCTAPWFVCSASSVLWQMTSCLTFTTLGLGLGLGLVDCMSNETRSYKSERSSRS